MYFSDGSVINYKMLISTLPLKLMMELTGLTVDATPDPSSSVVVINIGALRGPQCPKDHWVYIPKSKTGFYRVGFYSNVDPSFLPMDSRLTNDRVSIYVERAYTDCIKPNSKEMEIICKETVDELKRWGFIEEVEVIDPTWIDIAYTWTWPGSNWRERALNLLQDHNIYQVGRYGEWVFQGIADSIREGLMAGGAIR